MTPELSIPSTPEASALSATPPAELYRRARKRAAREAFLLALPLLLFLLATFIVPIAMLLARSVQNPEMPESMPQLTQVLQRWDGEGVPEEAVFAALATDLAAAAQDGSLGTVSRRMNFYQPEMRSLLMRSARNLPEQAPATWKAVLIDIDERWGEHETWRLLQRATQTPTADYLLEAVDAKIDARGSVVAGDADNAVYLDSFGRTIWISAVVTLLCLLLAYPVAWRLATLPPARSSKLMLLVIIPFWTSLLVRITAWYVMLQPSGVVNSFMQSLSIVSEPIPLMFNRVGVLIGMTHVLLPYMILAIYSVMKNVPPTYMRAAQSLGAHPVVAFVRVYMPQTLPGVGAGCFLVFVIAMGYYITPALLGGAGDEMISQLIAQQTNELLNWGLGGALSAYLMVFTLAFYLIFNRLVGIDRLRLG
ncbi:ABC transporter permease [Comamonas sp. NoAH]|uniref:ABC transporter permease n=1 Tax=Comamonas halotolerans TaxID=3041496 RepID=UPI0024E0ECC1|nr:ABC transporter permease [Comamonas sp. NoAH]